MQMRPNDKYTQEGEMGEGLYWVLLEDSFQNAVDEFCRKGKNGAAAVASRPVATTHDVPAEVVRQQIPLWNTPAETDEQGRFSRPTASGQLLIDTWYGMIAEAIATALPHELCRIGNGVCASGKAARAGRRLASDTAAMKNDEAAS
jgi:hypothetical protein